MSLINKENSNLYTIHNRVQLIPGGAMYFKRMEEMIDSAQSSIHLQVYIFDEDETGRAIADALIRARARNVLVYLLVDGYASQRLSQPFIDSLKATGIHFSYFEQVFRTRYFYIGRRLHIKVITVDAAKAMVGGVNISNRYNDINGIRAWMDRAVYAEGDIAEVLHKDCVTMWNKSILRPKYAPVKSDWPAFTIKEECHVRVRRNDWVKRRTEITKNYRELFRHSRSYITIMSGYFWPARGLLKKMANASKRGVKIKVILAGFSDVSISKHAERYLYRWLLRNNIEIYEYKGNVLHGKIAVCDNHLVTAGSYNVNNISAFASIELNLEVKNNDFAKVVRDDLDTVIKDDCLQITSANYEQNYNFFQRTKQTVAYFAVHLIFHVFTFYFRQDS